MSAEHPAAKSPVAGEPGGAATSPGSTTAATVGFRFVLCPCCGGRIGFKLYCPKCRVAYA